MVKRAAKKDIPIVIESPAERQERRAAQRQYNQHNFQSEQAQERLRIAGEVEKALDAARQADDARAEERQRAGIESDIIGNRPTTYSPELALRICSRVAISAASLDRICQEPGMPPLSSVLVWRRTYPEFEAQYIQAKEEQSDLLAESCLDIADTPCIGEKIKFSPFGIEVVRGDMVEHRKLQIETRKWLAAVLKPKYGNRMALTGGSGGPVEIKHVDSASDEYLENIARGGGAASSQPETGTD